MVLALLNDMKFAEIAVPVPIHQTYTYQIPEDFQASICPGYRVIVPLGQRKITGYVVALLDECDRSDLKPIDDLLDDGPALQPDLLLLARWISDYYICPLGEAIKAMLPSGINVESQIIITLQKNHDEIQDYLRENHVPTQAQILHQLMETGSLSIEELRKRVRRSGLNYSINRLVENGLVTRSLELTKPSIRPKFESWIRIGMGYSDPIRVQEVQNKLTQKNPREWEVFRSVLAVGEIARRDLAAQLGADGKTINRLIKLGYLEKFQKEVVRLYYSTSAETIAQPIQLNEYQQRALQPIIDAIDRGEYRTFLIHGVTGSGKTQVYIEALKHAIARGKTGIVLVPEISLTPQTVSRFTANFPDQVAVLHSRMSPGERFDSWRRLKRGELKIAIGPRSAIFAPLENLGMIIVDEEHEPTYKQMDNPPLYHARDVAVYRGLLNQTVVILGSATPSLESYFNAIRGKYQLLELPQRIDDIPLPQVTIIDMLQQRKLFPGKNISIFSKPLQEKILEKLKLNQQIILLQNRRGFSTSIKCKDCGFIERCPHCNITLTYHLSNRSVRCHYCNFTKRAPDRCPQCGGIDILFQGIGTQRVEQEIRQAFPEARVIRMDLDTTTRKFSHDKILRDFGSGKYNILLGTQMVAKGLDFQNVTLVGVISADTSLLFPDFRASERTFQLLTQVAGRAGRKNIVGEVYIQTYCPDNLSLKFAQQHDFKRFFLSELPVRKELNYPPFGRLVHILFSGENALDVQNGAEEFHQTLHIPDALGKILGPIPAPLTKLKNKYRWHMIIKVNKAQDPKGEQLRGILLEALNRFRAQSHPKGIKLQINVDPISLL
ncbi:MAG: primosomal protein N' [candidate division KSB1 bacterium]|nr:primosomal protein N' [candidate division KSB1 bacterium]MDZ7335093.1 primosomal protein N' [candidate division KSB1 bacterium]MDZ7356238.1 primosomal protein N' [candidate division KSB1 bacterium]MDZ7400043.1 primosomal protein N' [candidate division KSB1 bacterium]